MWGINEGWLVVMTPSGEKTAPQQQNWQRGEGRGVNGNKNIEERKQPLKANANKLEDNKYTAK